jgi:hypothetical protein
LPLTSGLVRSLYDGDKVVAHWPLVTLESVGKGGVLSRWRLSAAKTANVPAAPSGAATSRSLPIAKA